MTVYYNEFDPFAAAWLRELIKDGLIAPGEVDTRSICDVAPADVAGFAQVHLFAGIGGWSHALRIAGWPDDRPVWTGSCPCQPFSAAGKRKGTADARHLWPEMRRLVAECRPPVVFGEQVASKDGREWLSGVRADLEALGYGVGAADLCAPSVGAPHIRQRLYWTAERLGHTSSDDVGRFCRSTSRTEASSSRERKEFGLGGVLPRSAGTDGRLADPHEGQRGRLSNRQGRQFDGQATGRQQGDSIAQSGCDDGRLGDTDCMQPEQLARHGARPDETQSGRSCSESAGPSSFGAWRAVLIPCADGKFRRVPANEAGEPEPSLFPLAHGILNRVGTLRGAGNAIVPQVAAEFIKAAYE